MISSWFQKAKSTKYNFYSLNLETFSFVKKKLETLNFKEYISNQFHKKALLAGKKFVDGLKFNYELNYTEIRNNFFIEISS